MDLGKRDASPRLFQDSATITTRFILLRTGAVKSGTWLPWRSPYSLGKEEDRPDLSKYF